MSALRTSLRITVLLGLAPLFAAVPHRPESVAPAPAGEFESAAARSTIWNGPSAGPRAPAGKQIVLIADDLRNAGILGVAIGVREAAEVLGWRVTLIRLEGGGPDAFPKAVAEVLRRRADGVLLVGMEAAPHAAEMRPLVAAKIPVMGWHAGSEAGAIPGTPVKVNVTTDAGAVARVAAEGAIRARTAPAGVVVFTDTRYAIAVKKSDIMAAAVKGRPGYELLEVCDVPLDKAAEIMPELTRKLLTKYGARWTHSLGINDLYFDHSTPVFAVAGIPPEDGVCCVSAGDGSLSAFMRIRAGLYQAGTVAEPLNLQGWQLMDEMNRAFAGAPPSGYVTPVHWVDSANIAHDGGADNRFDPDNGYRDAYRILWGR